MIDKEKMEEYGKIKMEYDEFRKKRKELGLKGSRFININRMKENIKELKSLRV